MFITKEIKLFLSLLSQLGPQPKWIFWDVVSMKKLTKEGYIIYDRGTRTVSIANKGQEYVTKNCPPKQIDLPRWIKEHSFCNTQNLINPGKRDRLVDFLYKKNNLHNLYSLFQQIRERKRKIWCNRFIETDKRKYVVYKVESSGPWQIRLQVLDLQSGAGHTLGYDYYFQDREWRLGSYLSPDKVACLVQLYRGPSVKV